MEAQKQSGGGEGQRQPMPMPMPIQYQQYAYPYGTFHPPPSAPALGIPQPSPPPAFQPIYPGHALLSQSQSQSQSQTMTLQLHHPSPPCCRIGIGWILFIAGFFFAAIPWYVGAFIFFCVRVDHQEKPGLIACTIGAVIAAFAILLGLSNGSSIW